MFKIIAIQTLPTPADKYKREEGLVGEKKFENDLREARHDSVMKVLHPDVWYWLEKGYVYSEGKVVATNNVLPNDFYSERCPNISISAIVGENGMGKSSLLELLFRLVNNVSYALREGLEVQKYALHFVRDIYARLWYCCDDVVSYIEQNDGVIKIYNQNTNQTEYEFDYDNIQNVTVTSKEAKNHLRKLFYTIVVNYSQYAYNVNDYMAEWDDPSPNAESSEEQCWLNSLFHKNDAYQTPIVLNPFRESGNININRERDLTQTRLYYLVLNDASPLKRILRKKEAKSFIFDIDEDLNPIPNKRYYSKKVVLQMSQMRLLNKPRGDYKTVNDIGRRITAAWGHALGYEIESRNDKVYWDNMDDVRAINYIVYKTLKISRTYAKYFKYHNCFGDAKEVQKYIGELNKDTSHIMLKIRRCLAFLCFHHYGTGKVVDGKVIGNTMSVADFNKAINRCMDEGDDRYFELVKERYTTYYYKDDLVAYIWMPDELMPAPSFKTDMLLEGEDGNMVRFSSLSSGEKQMIYSVSTVLYQLRNIESTWVSPEQENVSYKNVCLVFDEIELYAHPKYQLLLINLLIESIKSLGLLHVLNIQIILATHSPFVLSDIPATNILCLEDGWPKEPEKKLDSFCANVYDILNNQFFMGRFVGDFANKKLDELIEEINKADTSKSEQERLIEKTKIIGDTFIRKLLLKKLAERNDKD